VAKPEWGTKRTCQSCGARFYDMRRAPIVCPKCNAVYDPEAVLKTRRGRAPVAEKPAPTRPPPKVVPAIDQEIEAEIGEPAEGEPSEEEEEEDVIEDASELGEDDNDMAEVIEKVDGKDEA